MSVEPVSYRLNTLIAESDGAINEARTAFEPYVKANRAIPKPMITRYYNMLMHRHALELQRTYPQAVVLTHIQFVSIMSPEGAELPLKAKKGEGRIPDAAVVYGDEFHSIEGKVRSQVLAAFPAGSRSRVSVEDVLPSSKFGTQLRKDKRILNLARRRGPYLLATGTPVLGGPPLEMLVPVEKVFPSRLQEYKNMGDGLPIPQRPPTVGMAGAPKPLTTASIVERTAAPSTRRITDAPTRPIPATPATPAARSPRPPGAPPPAAPAKPSSPGGRLQPPVPVRGVPPQPPVGDRGLGRPAEPLLRRPKIRWPPAKASRGGGISPPPMAPGAGPSTVAGRARGSAGALGAAAQEVTKFTGGVAKDLVWSRAHRAAGELEVRRQVEAHRNSGAWVMVSAAFWHDEADINASNDLRFRYVDVTPFTPAPNQNPDVETVRERIYARRGGTTSAKPDYRRGHGAEKPSHFHGSFRELELLPPVPKEEVVYEGDPNDPFHAGRCVVRKLR